ncbi:hypothetical protein OS493_016838 [Desmophyllum pertusum]|uniref:DUF6729 domain-containing protein n=1 Tax=Desmophyllum pertusum TaxID=174260 RepID=A0A9W9YNQ3_9CNID|nr:hypothetical protein OS493_016838 [Desmophyllum pertusum]
MCMIDESVDELLRNIFASSEEMHPNSQGAASQCEQIVLSNEKQTSQAEYPLLGSWRKHLPEVDHQWVSKALCKWSATGKPEIAYSQVNKLWRHPPEPHLSSQIPPKADRYFSQRLFLWLPKKLCRYHLVCPNSTCNNHELTSAGLYPVIHQVLDVDSVYNMVSEYLECSNCKKKYARDVRVIRMMRDRGLGNDPHKLYKGIVEQHNERYLQQTIAYRTQCKVFADASARGLVHRPTCMLSQPPAMCPVPKLQWLQNVYCQDVLQHVDEVKASITSVFGKILKMDSTSRVGDQRRYFIEAFDGEQGRDTLGVALFNHTRIWEEWEKAREHVSCILDPPGVKHYTEVGTITKLRCNTENGVHYQAYFLEGLMRWNQDRARAAVPTVNRRELPQSYSVLLRHAANKLSEEVFGQPIVPQINTLVSCWSGVSLRTDGTHPAGHTTTG